ncbi:hypothetical protein AMTRI_Chr03g143320 [Amborella trichopoda]
MDDEVMEVESVTSKMKKIQRTRRMEITLLHVLIEQVQACNKREKDFKPSQWNVVEKAFINATCMALKRENFKNKQITKLLIPS